MKWCVFVVALATGSLYAEDIYLSCQITQIAAKEGEGKADNKLKKIMKSLSASDETKKYQGFKFLSKKSLNATKVKSGSIKLKNGKKFSLKVVKVHRAQRQNTITVDVSLGSDEQQKSFIDQKYLILNAGELDKKSDLVIAVHCPVFP